MKTSQILLLLICFFSVLVIGCNDFIGPYIPPPTPTLIMKVNFYNIDREKIDKGEFVGFAELRDSKLITEVTDPKLEKILHSPYTTMTGGRKNGIIWDGLITYEPGTLEHLRAIAIECHRFGYIGEIVCKGELQCRHAEKTEEK